MRLNMTSLVFFSAYNLRIQSLPRSGTTITGPSFYSGCQGTLHWRKWQGLIRVESLQYDKAVDCVALGEPEGLGRSRLVVSARVPTYGCEIGRMSILPEYDSTADLQ